MRYERRKIKTFLKSQDQARQGAHVPTGRLPNVFTKLHAVGIEKYDKVIVQDTDVLVRNDMGHELHITWELYALCSKAHVFTAFDDFW